MAQDVKEPSAPGGDPNRRNFLASFFALTLGTVPLLGGLFFTMRAGLSPVKDNRPKRFRLCKLSEVPAAGSTEIKECTISHQYRQGPQIVSLAKLVFVTRDPDSGEILALSSECTHLGCSVKKRELSLKQGGKSPLVCPCHDGHFSQLGEVLDGPPKQALRRLKLDAIPSDPDGELFLLEI